MTQVDKQIITILNSFKQLLILDNFSKGTIRSYLSDTRHFLTWSSKIFPNIFQGFSLSTQGESLRESTKKLNGISLINRKTVNRYYDYFVENKTPRQTVNRRLSSLRRFGDFCVSQGWLTDNYFSYLKNVTVAQAIPEDSHHLKAYRQNLIDSGNTSQTIKNYLSDIRHFINWHACHPDENRDL